jgi:AcrR family transcriptional regulator
MSSTASPISAAPNGDTRGNILAAAIEILHASGAGALTVRSVATAAGCSTTGVYTWFGGKNGLVEAIFIDGFRRFGDTLLAVRAAAAPDKALLALAEAYREWAIANPTHYMVMFGRAVPDFEPSAEALAIARGTFATLVDAAGETVRERELIGEPDDIAHHLWAGMHGYVSLELAGMDMAHDADERTARFQRGLRRLLRGLRP